MVDFFSARVGTRVQLLLQRTGGAPSPLITPHMAAATRAILERIPLVDFTMEVRDARAPLSTAFVTNHMPMRNRRMILLNKADLADRSQTKKWIKHFEDENIFCHAVNAHNKDDIKGLLNFVRSRTKDLGVNESYTATFMLMGIPNVGKSAVVNALHQIGRISASEKGKLKHAEVTPKPGETKDITSYKIASHPNIFVLDTPGALSPEGVPDFQTASKLALIGAIQDFLVGELELGHYLLYILCSNDEYKRWQSLNDVDPATNLGENILARPELVRRKRKQYETDHTQNFIVEDVRRTLFNTISLFDGRSVGAQTISELIEHLLAVLHKAFRVLPNDGSSVAVAIKLLNLYRTGRLGRYPLDIVPD